MVERWLFRGLLGAVAVVMAAALVGSLDDIKRYVKISRM